MDPIEEKKWARQWSQVSDDFKSDDPDIRDQAYHLIARDVLLNLHRYKKTYYPVRADSISDDDEILAILRTPKNKRKVGDKRMLSFFLKWKAALLRTEEKAYSQLHHLLVAADIFRRLGMREEQWPLMELLEKEWGFRGELPGRFELGRLALHLSTDLDLLSADMRRGRREYRATGAHLLDNNDTMADLPMPAIKTVEPEPEDPQGSLL